MLGTTNMVPVLAKDYQEQYTCQVARLNLQHSFINIINMCSCPVFCFIREFKNKYKERIKHEKGH